MPGTPHHALGSPWLTAAAATVLALTVVAALVASRSRFSNPRRYAVAGGFAYTVVYLSLWAAVPAVFWRFGISPSEHLFFLVGVFGAAFAAAAIQSALALYLYAEWELKAPIVGLFAASLVSGYLFLRVGGESGATFMLFLWSTVIAPPGIVGIGVLGALETGFRGIHRSSA